MSKSRRRRLSTNAEDSGVTIEPETQGPSSSNPSPLSRAARLPDLPFPPMILGRVLHGPYLYQNRDYQMILHSVKAIPKEMLSHGAPLDEATGRTAYLFFLLKWGRKDRYETPQEFIRYVRELYRESLGPDGDNVRYIPVKFFSVQYMWNIRARELAGIRDFGDPFRYITEIDRGFLGIPGPFWRFLNLWVSPQTQGRAVLGVVFGSWLFFFLILLKGIFSFLYRSIIS